MSELQSLAGLFSAAKIIDPTTKPGGRDPITFKLSPENLGDLKLTTIVPGDLNLTWISKNVLFDNPNVENLFNGEEFDISQIDTIITDKLPVRLPRVTGALTGLLNEEIAGVQGLLSQLRGALPLVMELRVKVSVQWNVYDSETGGSIVTSGFTTLGSMNGFEMSLMFEPIFEELTTTAVVTTVDRFVEASVTLTLGTDDHTFQLPRIKVTIPAIPIPRLVAFFRHVDFQPISGNAWGAVFIVVPNNSPIRNLTQLQGALDILQSALNSLTSIARFAATLLGVQDLLNAMNAQPRMQFRIADSANGFNDFTEVVYEEGFLGRFGRVTAEDQLSSLIYISPSGGGKDLQCFNNRNGATNEGDFTIIVGEACHAKVANLHVPMLLVTPGGMNGASVSPLGTPPVGVFPSPRHFGDALSSMKFL